MTDEGERGGAEDATTGEEPVESAGASSSEKPGLVRLKWLKINKYRNVRPTTLRFDDGANLVLGLNGSGKTTLLELVAAVVSSRLDLINEEHDVEWELSLLDLRLSCRSQAHLDPDHDLNGGRDASARAPLKRVFLAEIASLGAGALYSVADADQTAVLRGPRLLREVSVVLPRWAEDEYLRLRFAISKLDDPDVQAVVALGFASSHLAATLRRSDEGLDTFRGLFLPARDEALLPAPKLYLERSARDRSPMRRVSSGNLGSLGDIAASVLGQLEPRTTAVRPELAPFLGVFERAIDARVEMSVLFTHTELDAVTEAWVYEGIALRITRGDGSIFSHDRLSFGQKRLFACLYYLAVNDYVVIADELVNGLHHSWIRLCLDQIGQRQAFLTSQNPLLLDYLPPSSVEQAQRQYLECRVDGDELVWENMSKEDADSVMTAWDAGIQQVSEILEIRGLW